MTAPGPVRFANYTLECREHSGWEPVPIDCARCFRCDKHCKCPSKITLVEIAGVTALLPVAVFVLPPILLYFWVRDRLR